MKRRFQATAAAVQESRSHADVVGESPYLTSREAADYLRFPTFKAFQEFLRRHEDFPRCRRGSALLFERRVLDAYVRGDLPMRRPKQAIAVLAHVRSVAQQKGHR
jgi:hypothetical protein